MYHTQKSRSKENEAYELQNSHFIWVLSEIYNKLEIQVPRDDWSQHLNKYYSGRDEDDVLGKLLQVVLHMLNSVFIKAVITTNATRFGTIEIETCAKDTWYFVNRYTVCEAICIAKMFDIPLYVTKNSAKKM
eukprot:TRINITY_DN7008_c0_g4_i1.p3 TRINITY_DN7008_c0_g4~~TRINITY_DN7008_c0_g4_i1.p3  ORF type:complete len:132 (+),score=5.47 TRINITY_DN7008_c0_g4_i1:104-499(+)